MVNVEKGAPSRPRNARMTSELILAAATTEFAEHGFAGARIDQIAERAGANKRLIYAYFNDKSGLYAAVLERQIETVMQNVEFSADDLPGFAVSRFDYVLGDPEVGRLATWRTIDRAAVPTEHETRTYAERVEAIARAQRAGTIDDTLPAVDLFALVLRMTGAWLSAPPALRAASGDPDGPERLAAHRAALVEAVRRLVVPSSVPSR